MTKDYTQVEARGKIDSDIGTVTWGGAGLVGGTLATHQLIQDKNLLKTHMAGDKPYLGLADGIVNKEMLKNGRPNANLNAGSTSFKTEINAAKEAVKNGADDTAKLGAKGHLTKLRAGKWGAALAGGAVLGTALATVGNVSGRMGGYMVGNAEQNRQGWAAKEDSRRNVTVNLENAR